MKYLILLLSLLLTACGTSPDTRYYVLNPIPVTATKPAHYTGLRLGINEINLAEYLEKPQIAIHVSPHQLDLQEDDQWAEPLDKNIARVLVANLMTLLPGSVVAVSPWEEPFKPTLLLQVNVIDLKLDNQGRAVFSADYMLFRDQQLLRKQRLRYTRTIHPPAVANLVQATNDNLTQFSSALAAAVRSVGALQSAK